jgi:hypothetical protein
VSLNHYSAAIIKAHVEVESARCGANNCASERTKVAVIRSVVEKAHSVGAQVTSSREAAHFDAVADAEAVRFVGTSPNANRKAAVSANIKSVLRG